MARSMTWIRGSPPIAAWTSRIRSPVLSALVGLSTRATGWVTSGKAARNAAIVPSGFLRATYELKLNVNRKV